MGQAASSSVRIDRWLWTVRVFKTRTTAKAACQAQDVLVNEVVVKPSAKVAVNDVVEVSVRDRVLVFKVLGVLDRRVSASKAAECYLDLSPPAPPRQAVLPSPGLREPGQGRPTKKERRQIDRLRRRSE